MNGAKAMTRTRRFFVVAVVLAAIGSIRIADARADEIKVLYALPLQPGLVGLAEQFHRETGHTITFDIPTGADLAALLASDAPADILIGTPAAVDRAIADGKTAGPRTPVGRVGISAVVRRGTPVPDIATVEALKRAVLAADSVAYNTAGSGQYVQRIFDQIGIGDEIKAKTARPANGPQTMDHVMRSTGNEIGFGLTPEAYPYAEKGVQTVGPLPPSLQTYTSYDAVVLSRTKSPMAAAQFLGYITTPAARKALAATGVE
jgi:molybdate transport system substrate-binding protein